MKIIAYISKQGVRYDATKYNNHGLVGVHRGMMDLPKEGYPYTCEMRRVRNDGVHAVVRHGAHVR
jgi:hypothetical protein